MAAAATVVATGAFLPNGRSTALAATAVRPSPTPHAADDSVFVSPKWLAARANDPSVVVLFVSTPRDEGTFAERHVPGARALSIAALASLGNMLTETAPPLDDARAALERAGVSTGSTVVLYGNPAPMLFLVLKFYLGVDARILDGGLIRWTAEGRPVSKEIVAAIPGRIAPHVPSSFIVNAEWVQAHLKTKGIVLLDTRSQAEYEGLQGPAFTKGHIPGALQITNENLVPPTNPQTEFQLRPAAQIRAQFSERAQPGDTIVTYCTIGSRALKSFLVALHLGYPAKIYIGSYSDWVAKGLPLVAGSKP